MATIKLEDLKQQLGAEHQIVLSPEYVNLKTIMQFKCPYGHNVYAPQEQLRKALICPVCSKLDMSKFDKMPTKKDKNIRVLALDQASRLSGYSIYSGKNLIKFGTFQATETEDEIIRFSEVKEWLISAIENQKPDVVGIEGIQYQPKVGVTTFQTLARLQGILMMACKEANVPYVICMTNTWRNHVGVKGSTRTDKKASMRHIIKGWYGLDVSEDEADAIGIGRYVADLQIPQHEVEDQE